MGYVPTPSPPRRLDYGPTCDGCGAPNTDNSRACGWCRLPREPSQRHQAPAAAVIAAGILTPNELRALAGGYPVLNPAPTVK